MSINTIEIETGKAIGKDNCSTDVVKLPIVFRSATLDDVGYILNSWLKGYKATGAKNMTNEAYYALTEPLFKSILMRSGAIVACDPVDLTFILGYVVAEHLHDELVVNWINTKQIYRQAGIAKALFKYINPSNKKVIASFHVDRLKKVDKTKYKFTYLPEIIGRLHNLPTTPIAQIEGIAK